MPDLPQTTVTNAAPPLEVKAPRKPTLIVAFKVIGGWAKQKWLIVSGVFGVAVGVLAAYHFLCTPFNTLNATTQKVAVMESVLTLHEQRMTADEKQTSFWHDDRVAGEKEVQHALGDVKSSVSELTGEVRGMGNTVNVISQQLNTIQLQLQRQANSGKGSPLPPTFTTYGPPASWSDQ